MYIVRSKSNSISFHDNETTNKSFHVIIEFDKFNLAAISRVVRRFASIFIILFYVYFVFVNFDWCFRTWRIFNVKIVGTKINFDTIDTPFP